MLTNNARFLRKKSALVTGSTSGIGLGIARSLAAAGADVMLNGFGDPEEIAALCAALEAEFGVAVLHNAADLTDPVAIGRMLRGAKAAFGKIDILVNNAGMQHVAPVEEFPAEKWDAILALNLSAVFRTTSLCVQAMRDRGWGRIINVASAHGLVASPYKSAYVAAKHGVVGFTKAVALECARSGVTVNAICPGYVLTPLVEKQIDQQALVRGLPRERVIEDVILAAQPNKRFATVEEIGAMALHLCGPFSAGITGASFVVDGGWTAA